MGCFPGLFGSFPLLFQLYGAALSMGPSFGFLLSFYSAALNIGSSFGLLLPFYGVVLNIGSSFGLLIVAGSPNRPDSETLRATEGRPSG